jgi:DNA polymerase III delta subunit
MMAKKGEPESISLPDRLKEKGLEPLYLVEGKEAFLRARAIEELRTFAGPNPAETKFEGSKAQLSQVLDELRTLPFLASVRIVFLDEAEEFLAKNGEGLERALQEITGFKKTALVLETEGLDARFKLSKLVRELAVRVSCDTPDEQGLLRFARDRAKARGRSFARGADAALLDRFGGGAGIQVDLGILDGEVAKLCSTQGETPITVEQVEALACSLTAEDTFAVVGAVGRGDLRGALESLRAVFRDGAVVDGERRRQPQAIAPMLLGLLAWDVGRLYKARSLLDAGRSANDVVSELRAWRERDAFIARARGSTPEVLRRAHALLRDADKQLKDSGEPFEILTTLVARLALMGPRAKAAGRPLARQA